MVIWLDMDGVLCDFQRGIMKFKGLPMSHFDFYDKPISWGWCTDQWPEVLDQLDRKFWVELPWAPGAAKLLELVKRRTDKIGILSDHCLRHTSVEGKIEWIKANIPELASNCFFGKAKHLFAHKDSILIDDGDHNIKAFEAAGGKGILVPRLWNSAWEREGQCPSEYFHI